MMNRCCAAAIAGLVILAIGGCGRGADIRIVQATYGANCGAPAGNTTLPLVWACDGKRDCSYRIDHTIIGDPAPGCAKSFQATWRCTGEPSARRVELPGEAGFGSIAILTCRAS